MAKTETKEMSLFSENVPAHIRQGSGRGNERTGMEDVTIPRLEICQSLSPQRKKNDPKYIDGISENDMFNTVTGENYGTEVLFVPVLFKKEYLVWKDQKKGGGLAGIFNTEAEAERHRKSLEGADDYESVLTHQQFGLLVTKGGHQIEEIVVSMAKSKMGPSKKLNTFAKMAGGDRFSRIYKLETYEDRNKEGQTYGNYKVSSLGYVNEEIYNRAEALYEAVSSGSKDVNRDYEAGEAANSASTTPDDLI